MTEKRHTRIPTYRLHKASGRAVVTLPGPCLGGRRDVFLGRFGTAESRQRYAQVIAEWTAKGDVRPEPTSDITIIELVDRYWPHVRGYYVKDGKPTSEQEVIKQALAPLLKLYGLTPAAEFGPLDLKTVRQTMVGKDWCRNYVNKQCSRIKMLFAWAVENELIPATVFHGLQAVKGLRKGRSEVRESDPVRPVADGFSIVVFDIHPGGAGHALELFTRADQWLGVHLPKVLFDSVGTPDRNSMTLHETPRTEPNSVLHAHPIADQHIRVWQSQLLAEV